MRQLSTVAGRLAPFAALAMLAACASQPKVQLTATQEAAQYFEKAKKNYAPPGPPSDPWGPYIREAAAKYDVPQAWIRGVMRVESGGYQFRATGTLTTSPVGAMGLMQLMPETYDELRARYGFGDDAYDPHDNIMAGAAYIREMYDAFGSPGFLAAYNGGPARLEDYLVHNRPLPTETRRYVAMIGPEIRGISPEHRSPAELLAMNQLPDNIPAGPRWVVHHHNYALASRRRGTEATVRYAALERHAGAHGGSQARMPEPPVEVAEAPPARAPIRLAAYASKHGGFHLIQPAMAADHVAHGGGHGWSVQSGGKAAKGATHAHGGLTHDAAVSACHGHAHCLVISPAATRRS